jgi:hypothetical protein
MIVHVGSMSYKRQMLKFGTNIFIQMRLCICDNLYIALN